MKIFIKVAFIALALAVGIELYKFKILPTTLQSKSTVLTFHNEFQQRLDQELGLLTGLKRLSVKAEIGSFEEMLKIPPNKDYLLGGAVIKRYSSGDIQFCCDRPGFLIALIRENDWKSDPAFMSLLERSQKEQMVSFSHITPLEYEGKSIKLSLAVINVDSNNWLILVIDIQKFFQYLERQNPRKSADIVRILVFDGDEASAENLIFKSRFTIPAREGVGRKKLEQSGTLEKIYNKSGQIWLLRYQQWTSL